MYENSLLILFALKRCQEPTWREITLPNLRTLVTCTLTVCCMCLSYALNLCPILRYFDGRRDVGNWKRKPFVKLTEGPCTPREQEYYSSDYNWNPCAGAARQVVLDIVKDVDSGEMLV